MCLLIWHLGNILLTVIIEISESIAFGRQVDARVKVSDSPDPGPCL